MSPGSGRRKSRQQDYDDEDSGSSQNGNGMTMLHLSEGLIPKFTGQDKTYPAARWVQDVEDNSELCGWTPLQQLLMARRSLSGTALLWFRAERTFKTWDDFKGAILKEFPDTIDAKAIHELMSSRHKKQSESCLEYVIFGKGASETTDGYRHTGLLHVVMDAGWCAHAHIHNNPPHSLQLA